MCNFIQGTKINRFGRVNQPECPVKRYLEKYSIVFEVLIRKFIVSFSEIDLDNQDYPRKRMKRIRARVVIFDGEMFLTTLNTVLRVYTIDEVNCSFRWTYF